MLNNWKQAPVVCFAYLKNKTNNVCAIPTLKICGQCMVDSIKAPNNTEAKKQMCCCQYLCKCVFISLRFMLEQPREGWLL